MLRGVTEECGLCAVCPTHPALPLSSRWPVGKCLSFAKLPVLYLQMVWVVTVAASHSHCEDRMKWCVWRSVYSTGTLFNHTWLPAAAGAAAAQGSVVFGGKGMSRYSAALPLFMVLGLTMSLGCLWLWEAVGLLPSGCLRSKEPLHVRWGDSIFQLKGL